jgi:hypothetical protein
MMVIPVQPGDCGEGGGCMVHAHPLLLYLPSRAKLWCTLQLRGQIHSPFFSSTPIFTLLWKLSTIYHVGGGGGGGEGSPLFSIQVSSAWCTKVPTIQRERSSMDRVFVFCARKRKRIRNLDCTKAATTSLN